VKFFPISILKILPAIFLTASMGALLSSCHTSTASVEASTTRNPVVAPAGTVLRVRLNQTLETGRSRPGDRFGGTLDAPVMSGSLEILPKGTRVEGHVEPGPGLAIALDCYERDGAWYALSTRVVSRKGNPQPAGFELNSGIAGSAIGGADTAVSVAADSIIGFTLTKTLTA